MRYTNRRLPLPLPQLWSQPELRIKFWPEVYLIFTCLQSSARLLTEYWRTETYFI